jgi:carboxyl-terminal processing protease
MAPQAAPRIGDASEVLEVLKEQSVFAADAGKLRSSFDKSVQGYLQSIDPHAEYYPNGVPTPSQPSESRSYGFEVFDYGGAVWALPYMRGPVADAGVTDLAKILSADGVSVAGKSANDVAARMAGRREATFGFQIADKVIEVTVRARPVKFEPVEIITGTKYNLIRIHEFVHGETLDQLREKLQAVLSQDSAAPLVIDLRHCRGGELNAAFDSASLFTGPNETLAYLEDARGNRERIRAPAGVTRIVPDRHSLAILTSELTASAAEAFIMALQQHQKAQLVGTRTFGKCTSQTEYSLRSGGTLVLSNLKVLGPNRKGCEGRGLEPDIRMANSAVASLEAVSAELAASSLRKD